MLHLLDETQTGTDHWLKTKEVICPQKLAFPVDGLSPGGGSGTDAGTR